MTGLTPTAQSTDVQAPVSVITSPTHLQSIPAYVPITITGTASDVGGVVAGVEISFDGGVTWKQVVGTTNWSYSWTLTVESSYTIKVRGFDDSGNMEAVGSSGSSNNITVNVTP